MEKIGRVGTYESGAPIYLVTMATAASIIGESIEDTEKLVFAGHLTGFLPFQKGTWHVTVHSLERWIGRPLNVQPQQEE